MNRIAGILIIFITVTANAGMVRFVRAVDGQTIVVDRNGTQVVVTLDGVNVQPEDQTAARTFLERELAGKWLLVENGNVYRSPDTLFVNGAMRQRGYINPGAPRERYLGEADFDAKKSEAAPKRATPDRRPESRSDRRTSRRSTTSRRRG